MKCPEQFRVPNPGHAAYVSRPGDTFGVFSIPVTSDILFCIASDGTGFEENGSRWEHVSVTVRNRRGLPLARCATWAQMCIVKDAFWGLDECVIQFHPPEKDYVNNHNFCLHLWRLVGADIPQPPSIFVGLKGVSLTP